MLGDQQAVTSQRSLVANRIAKKAADGVGCNRCSQLANWIALGKACSSLGPQVSTPATLLGHNGLALLPLFLAWSVPALRMLRERGSAGRRAARGTRSQPETPWKRPGDW